MVVQTERRHHERRRPEAEDPLARTRTRAGAELAVSDISAMGVLVEGTVRLAPGSRVDIHLMTRSGRVLVRGRVVRAYVSELRADLVRYRGALLFDQDVDTSAYGYSMPAPVDASPADPGMPYP
ncbi:MAG TPA: PilZ domain-containing protein [Vicinamibacterales bacterium]|nr:PilZ domain-containing protein [Vicinamibacterales bacterium]